MNIGSPFTFLIYSHNFLATRNARRGIYKIKDFMWNELRPQAIFYANCWSSITFFLLILHSLNREQQRCFLHHAIYKPSFIANGFFISKEHKEIARQYKTYVIFFSVDSVYSKQIYTIVMVFSCSMDWQKPKNSTFTIKRDIVIFKFAVLVFTLVNVNNNRHCIHRSHHITNTPSPHIVAGRRW